MQIPEGWVSLMMPRAGAVLLTVLAAWFTLWLLSTGRRRVERTMKAKADRRDVSVEEANHRIETVLRVGYDVAKILVYAFATISALGQMGVSVQPLVAGAGLVGAAVALGSQTVVKDFVSGFFILLENHFAIGDTVVLGTGLTGVVEKMTLRVTVLRDLDGAVHIVPNGIIGAVTNKTYRWGKSSVTFTLPAETGIAEVRRVLEKAAAAIAARDGEKAILLDAPVVSGPLDIKGGSIDWSVAVKAKPAEMLRVRSWIVEEVAQALREAKVPLIARPPVAGP
jgi:moderate conductance mechanosensitive channel